MSNLALLPPTAHCAVADRVEPYGLVANGYGPCTTLALDRSGRHVAAGYERGALFVWDLSVRDAAPARAAVAAHANGVRDVTWLSSTSIATSGGDRSITVWRLHLGRGRLFCRARAAFDGVSLDSYDRALLAVSTQVPPRVFACRDLPLGNETEFEVGDRVQARWNGEPTYYVGTLTSVNPYAIDYDDGDHEDDVDLSLIRASRLPDPPRYPAPDAAPPACSTVLEGRDVGAVCDAACFVSNDIFAARGEDCWCGEATLKLHGKVKAVASASRHVACACSDGAVRILKVDTSIILLHSLRNPIDKVQFSSPSFGAGGEHLVAAAHVGSQVQFYVWEVQSGHCLARPRDDDKDSQDRGPVRALACHANGAVICTAAAHASQHAIRVWAAPDGFSWRAYAPNFEELHENITYNEREDEFDSTVDSKAPSQPQAEIEALLGAHGCTLDDVLRVEATVFDAASGEWVPNADGAEELAFDDTWAAPERARFRRALAALQGEDDAEAPATVAEVVAEESELLDAVGLPPRPRSRSPSPAPSWSSEDEEPPASPASSPSLPSSSPSLEPAPKVTPPSPPASPRQTTKASPLRVKQVARQRKAVPPPPAVVELAAAPSPQRFTVATGDWRIAGAQVANADDTSVRGAIISRISAAFWEVRTTKDTVVNIKNSQLTQTTLTDEEAAICSRALSSTEYLQARVDGLICVRYGGREFNNCYTSADGAACRQIKVTATGDVRCAICRGDTPFSWSSETPWRTLSGALKNHTGHNPSQHENNTTQTHLDLLIQSAGAETEDDGSDERGAEERPTRRHLVAAAEAAPEESSDEDMATLREAKPTNKPRDASMAPEPVTGNCAASNWRCVSAHAEDADDPTVRGIITSCPNKSAREVTTTSGAVVLRKNAEIIQTTLTDAEVARCVRPTSMKDYVQARIDGAIETRCGGRDYKNRYTTADGTERRQFEATATHVQCALCPNTPTWPLDPDVTLLLKALREHCGQTGRRGIQHGRSLEASLASRALPSPRKAPPMSPAPLPKRKKPSPLATEKKASPLATDPRKRARQLSGAEAAQARAEAVWAGLAAPSAPPPPPPTFPPSPPPHPPIYFDVYTLDVGGTQLFGRLDLSGAERLTFGRDGEHVDVPLDHVSISRHHATIRFEGGVTYIADMKSNNGTFVQALGGAEERITTSRLREGSVVRFGAAPRCYVLRRSEDGLPRPAGDTWPRLAELGASPSGAKRGPPIPKKPDAPPIPKRVRPESLAAVPPPPTSSQDRRGDRRGDWRGRAPHEGDRDRRGPSTSPRANFGERLADRAARFGPPPGPPPFEARLADRAARFSPPPSPRGNFGEKKAARAARFGPPPGPSPFEARLADRAARFSPPPSPRSSQPPQQNPPLLLDDADTRKIFVEAMRKSASESEIKAFFAAAGEVTEVQHPLDAAGAPTGYCFVTFASPDAVTRAVATMQGAEFQGKKITIARMDPARARMDPARKPQGRSRGGPLPDGADPRKVYVGNILYTASDSEVKAFFAAAVGKVTEMYVPLDAAGAPKGVCFLTFASAESAARAVATMDNAEFQGRKLHVNWCEPKGPCKFWSAGYCKDGARCQFSHDGPAGRGRGGFAGTVLARHCADARSASDGGGHREPRGPAPPHAFPPRGFGPTRLSEAVRHRLDAPALNALAELYTADADAVVQSLEQAGAKVCDPTAYVCKAVERVRRGGMPGIGIRSRCFNCGESGHLARDCPSDGGGHREPRGPAPPHALPRSVQRPPRGFGPTALSEAVSRRLDEPSMRLLAQLETADADAIAQRLEEAGGTVRNPSGYVMKAVERVRRGGTAGWNGAVGRCATCGAQGHLARDCPSAARGTPLDSLASLPSPPSARGSRAPRPGDWICGVCTNHNFASRIECNRCGTPKSGEQPNGRVGGFQVPRPTRGRSRSRSRERRGRRGHRS